MPKEFSTHLASELAAHRAARRAALGPVELPSQMVMDIHGLNFFIGQQVRDTVTGQVVEVIGGGTVQSSNKSTEP